MNLKKIKVQIIQIKQVIRVNSPEKSILSQNLSIWPGSSPSNIYRDIIKLSVSYSISKKSPDDFVRDFFNWCGIDYKSEQSITEWPEAIDICTSFLIEDRNESTFH